MLPVHRFEGEAELGRVGGCGGGGGAGVDMFSLSNCRFTLLIILDGACCREAIAMCLSMSKDRRDAKGGGEGEEFGRARESRGSAPQRRKK